MVPFLIKGIFEHPPRYTPALGEAAGALTLVNKTSRCQTKWEMLGNMDPLCTYFDAIAGNKTSTSKTPPTVQAWKKKGRVSLRFDSSRICRLLIWQTIEWHFFWRRLISSTKQFSEVCLSALLAGKLTSTCIWNCVYIYIYIYSYVYIYIYTFTYGYTRLWSC